MTFKQLSYFVTIYETGSISGAADTLYISQQALCRILGTLEKELGTPLFTRSRAGVSPTELGTELYRSCQAVISEMTTLEQHIQAFIRSNTEHLNIGLAAGFRYLSPNHAKSLWSDFQNKYAQIMSHANECGYLEGLAQLKDQSLDFLTFSDYTPEEEYLQIPLHTLDRVLIVPRGHPLYEKNVAEISDIRGERVAISANHYAYQRFLKLCEQKACQPSEIFRVSDTLYEYEACRSDHCIGITIAGYFSDAFLPQFPSLKLLRFEEEFLPYTVSAIFRRDHPKKRVMMDLAHRMKAFLDNEDH